MPYKYSIIDEAKLIYVKALEPATIAETKELFINITADKLFNPDDSMLVEATEIITPFSVDDAAWIGEYLGKFPIKNIVIVSNNNLIFGTGRLISAYAENVGIKMTIMRDMATAKRALGLTNINF